MAQTLFQNPEVYPDQPLSQEARRNFRRRSAVWRQTLPLQIALWLLIPGISVLGTLYTVHTAPFYRTVDASAVFWQSLWVIAFLMIPFLVLFYAVQWRRAVAPTGAMKRRLSQSSKSIELEYLPFHSQNLDRHKRLYPEAQRCRERTTIHLNEITDIRFHPDCDCLVVYGPVHFVAKKGNKIVKKGTVTGKYGYRVYCGLRELRQLAEKISLFSGVPVREMGPRDRIPVEKQVKIWLV